MSQSLMCLRSASSSLTFFLSDRPSVCLFFPLSLNLLCLLFSFCNSPFLSPHTNTHTDTQQRHLIVREPRAMSCWQQYKAHLTMNPNVRIALQAPHQRSCWMLSFFRSQPLALRVPEPQTVFSASLKKKQRLNVSR